LLGQISEIITPSSMLALVAMGMCGTALITAILLIAGYRYLRSLDRFFEGKLTGAHGELSAGFYASPFSQFVVFAVWMLIATLVVIALGILIFLGTLSSVQLQSMAGKMGGGDPGAILVIILFVVMLWSACLMALSCIYAILTLVRRTKKHQGIVLSGAILLVGAVVGAIQVILSTNVFASTNTLSINYGLLARELLILIGFQVVVITIGIVAANFLHPHRHEES
jgi:hypothetical protein